MHGFCNWMGFPDFESLVQHEHRLHLLLQVLADRTHSGRLQRFFGGDYRHGGILRRNAVQYGIRLLKANDEQTREVLREALANDPYFEVRSWAAQVLGEQCGTDDEIERVLFAALDDDSPEVVVQALSALGKVGRSGDLLERLRLFYLHPNWQFRHGVILAFIEFLRRGILQPEQLQDDLDQVLASTPYFKPVFILNERLHELSDMVRSTAPAP